MPERDSGWVGDNVVDAEDARLATGSLVAAGNTPIQARTGLRPAPGAGRVLPTSPASGQVQVSPFQGVIQGTRSATAGAYLVTLDQTKTIDVLGAVPAHATHARYDLIVAQQTDKQYGDSVSGMTVSLVAGTPAQTPQEPTVTGDVIVLARITVPANATTIALTQIQDRRVFTSSIGGVVPVHGAQNRPATPYGGQLAYRQDLALLEAFDGNAWKPAAANAIAMYDQPEPGFPADVHTVGGELIIFNKLRVPPVYFGRRLFVTAHTMIGSTGKDDRYDVTLTANGAVEALTVVNSAVGAGMVTAHITAIVNQAPDTGVLLQLGIQRMGGTGTVRAGFGGSAVYNSCNVLAIPS